MCKFLLLLIAVGFGAMGFLVQGATTWSAEPTAATDLPTDGRILFRVQVSKR